MAGVTSIVENNMPAQIALITLIALILFFDYGE